MWILVLLKENSFLRFSSTSWRHAQVQAELHPFLTLALVKCESPASCSGSFKGTYHLLERRLGGPKSWSGCSGKEIKLFLSLIIIILMLGEDDKITKHHTNNHATCTIYTRNPRNQDWQHSHILMILHQVNLEFYKDIHVNEYQFLEMSVFIICLSPFHPIIHAIQGCHRRSG